MKQTAIDFLLYELQIKFLIRLIEIKSEPSDIVRETMIYNFLNDIEQFKKIEIEMIVDFTKWYNLNYFVYNGFTKTTKVEDMFKIFLNENINKT